MIPMKKFAGAFPISPSHADKFQPTHLLSSIYRLPSSLARRRRHSLCSFWSHPIHRRLLPRHQIRSRLLLGRAGLLPRLEAISLLVEPTRDDALLRGSEWIPTWTAEYACGVRIWVSDGGIHCAPGAAIERDELRSSCAFATATATATAAWELRSESWSAAAFVPDEGISYVGIERDELWRRRRTWAGGQVDEHVLDEPLLVD